MVDADQLARSKAIHRQTGKTFYVATKFLPEYARLPTYVLYGFFRKADEIVDGDTDLDDDEKRERLEAFREAALGRAETDDPVLSAFSEIREARGIDDEDVNSFVDAMQTDIEKRRYETYAELEAYMDGSAAAVGRMMTAVLDPPQADRALPYATALGEAFQLTNFCRDVREDVVERDRVYLPAETFRAHGVDHDQVARLEFDDDVAAAVQTELKRAESLYEKGVEGIQYLPRDCQFPILLAAILYADHHRLIRDLNYDVLSTTPSISLSRKLYLAARARIEWQLDRDPVTVFHKLSSFHGEAPGGRLCGLLDRLPVP